MEHKRREYNKLLCIKVYLQYCKDSWGQLFTSLWKNQEPLGEEDNIPRVPSNSNMNLFAQDVTAMDLNELLE